jgi:flagellar capping protein FliD
MDLLSTTINAAVVAVVGALLAWLGKGRFDALDRKIDGVETGLAGRIDRLETRLDGRIDGIEARFDGLETRFDGRIDGLEARFDRRFDTLQASMDAMRSDLTQVALAVGIRPRAQND